MNWNEYREQPDEGLFNQIEHRLRMRRMWRVGGIAASVCAVAAVVAVVAWPKPNNDVAMQQGVDMPVAEAVTMAETTTEQSAETAKYGNTAVEIPAANSAANVAEAAAPAAAQRVAGQRVDPVAEPAAVRKPVAATAQPAVTEVVPTPVVANAEASNAADEPKAAVTEAVPMPKVGGQSTDTVKHSYRVMMAPNVIAPAADNDDNRYFTLTPTEAVSQFTVQIYNRRGQRIFTSSDPAFRWDGTYDGNQVSQGAYVWVATFRDAEGRSRQEQGSVVVVR